MVCGWLVFVPAVGATILALLARRSTWLYLRIREQRGRHFTLALPMPLSLVGWAARLARLFTPAEKAPYLKTAVALAEAMRDDPHGDPLYLSVDDPDGDQVQIYLG
jgi:hypothetical protein